MKILFADDAGQNNPAREGMGRLVAAGGVIVDSVSLGALEIELDRICHEEFEFPIDEVFKWSPQANHWMRSNLIDERRSKFFQRVLECAALHEVKAVVAVNDSTRATATSARSHSVDVLNMVFERFHNFLGAEESGLVIAAQPSGGPAQERVFLSECRKTLSDGTDYVQFDKIPINALTSPFHHSRSLQLADLVVSCTTALVAGHSNYAQPVFENVKPLFPTNMGCIGGLGVKIHPDFLYVNLYHWLFGDDHHIQFRRNIGIPLPASQRPYASDPMQESVTLLIGPDETPHTL